MAWFLRSALALSGLFGSVSGAEAWFVRTSAYGTGWGTGAYAVSPFGLRTYGVSPFGLQTYGSPFGYGVSPFSSYGVSPFSAGAYGVSPWVDTYALNPWAGAYTLQPFGFRPYGGCGGCAGTPANGRLAEVERRLAALEEKSRRTDQRLDVIEKKLQIEPPPTPTNGDIIEAPFAVEERVKRGGPTIQAASDRYQRLIEYARAVEAYAMTPTAETKQKMEEAYQRLQAARKKPG